MIKKVLHTESGYEITVQTFVPESLANTVVLILPANGTKQAFYSGFARFLKSKSLIVYTLDYGGIGESKKSDLRSFDTSITNWGKYDLEAVLSAIRSKHSDKKLVVIAHSMGGQIFGLAPSSISADKLIFVAVPSGYLNFWTGVAKMKMFMTWFFMFPALTKLYGYMPASKISGLEDLPKSVALEWREWCLSPNYLFDYIGDDERWYEKIGCPLVSFSVEDDSLAPEKAVDWMTNQYVNCMKIRIHVEPAKLSVERIGHFGFFKESNRETLWPMLLKHIED